jgi:hypothetical protein
LTISTTTIKNSYNGDGSTTAFTYTFKVADQNEIEVIIRSSNGTETVKTLTTHYTVSGVGNAGGGTVTFTSGNIPVSGETVVLRRDTDITQTMDLIDNDPMSADTIETAHDKSIAIAQELQEQIDRSIKLSRTNTMTSTEFTVDAATRANKILAFDDNGEISVTQELGTFVGDWSSGTSYNARDLVKDTSTNNIFICTTSHTSSGSQPLTTNTDSAKWSLIVDAASATSSATAAAASASAAATSETNAATSESNAATSETNAATSETNAATSATTASTAATNAGTSETNAATSETNASTSATAAASSATSAASSATTATTQASAASTSATNAATSASNASTSETNAATSASNAATSETNAATSATTATTQATNAATSATSAASSATAAQTAQTAAELALDNFTDIYLGDFSTAPTVDNDGDPLAVGMMYYDISSNQLKIYSSSGWQNAGSSVNGTSGRYTYTISGTPTSVTGADDDGNTLAYDAGFIDVYLNGVKQVNGTDVTVTSGDTVTFASALSNGDIVDIVTFGTFNVATIDGSAITTGTINNARLTGSGAITINGSAVSLGGSVTIGETKPTISSISPSTITNAQTSITITGSNYSSVPQVEFLNPSTGIWYLADTVTFNNSTSLTVQATLSVDATYKIRIENPDGNAVLSSTNILTVSDAPTWTTAAGTLGTIAGDFSGTLATVVATSDSAVTYSEVSSPLVLTNAAQANCSLNSSTGAITTTDFGGSSTTATTYNFTIRATDAEGQTADRSFSLTSSFGATGGAQFN